MDADDIARLCDRHARTLLAFLARRTAEPEVGVLLDPKTAEVPLPAGTVITDTAYLERRVVDELP